MYGTNAIVGMVNGLFVTYMGIVVNQPGMATPIAGPIVALGFNDVTSTVITIVVVAIISLILSFIIGTFINKKQMGINLNTPKLNKQVN